MALTADEIVAIESGRPWRRGMPSTRCRLRLYEREGERPVAVVTELADNPGLSVTNAAEHIWAALAQRLDTYRFTLIEHYGPQSFSDGREPHHFDVVTVREHGGNWRRTAPDAVSWRRITREAVRELVGEDVR